MNFLAVVVIGAVLGALDGVGIFFEPKEPYKWQILFAATLKGVLVALLTGFSLVATTRWWSAMVTGALYGLAFGLVIYLAKGGPKSGDAPYMIPSGITTFSVISVASYARDEDASVGVKRCLSAPIPRTRAFAIAAAFKYAGTSLLVAAHMLIRADV